MNGLYSSTHGEYQNVHILIRETENKAIVYDVYVRSGEKIKMDFKQGGSVVVKALCYKL
jgi:hypothetical protein